MPVAAEDVRSGGVLKKPDTVFADVVGVAETYDMLKMLGAACGIFFLYPPEQRVKVGVVIVQHAFGDHVLDVKSSLQREGNVFFLISGDRRAFALEISAVFEKLYLVGQLYRQIFDFFLVASDHFFILRRLILLCVKSSLWSHSA